MSRVKIIGGNWKSNPATQAAVKELCEALKGATFDTAKVQAVLFTVTIHGDLARGCLEGSKIETGIQNISKTGPGAFTGEITAEMAKEAGNKWALIGHSERRKLYGETIEDTVAKWENCFKAGLPVTFAIGEQLEEREAGTTDAVNQGQLGPVLDAIKAKGDEFKLAEFVIAYEPVWAIGTGKVATPEQAQETCKNVREFCKTKMGEEFANNVRIQYGGSSSPDNIEGLASQPDIDGFLVGGASLKPSFKDMIEHLNK